MNGKLLITACLALLFLITGCSQPRPTLNRRVVPVSYDIASIRWENTESDALPIRYFWINDDEALINVVIGFWNSREFRELFKSIHPIVEVDRKSILNLRLMLRNVLDIYYVYANIRHQENADTVNTILSSLEEELNCRPLSNNELLFMSSSNPEEVFEQKSLTMLMISSIEILLQKGAKPVYPKVLSGYLRKRFHLAPLKPVESMNLFASKKRIEVYSGRMEGFVFCRKQI